MKKFSDLTTKLSESKYGDAMTSRLPSHLDDPRREPVTPSDAYLKEKKKRELHFANKGTIRVKESVYESYRDRALEEAKLHHTLKGHPYHHKSDAELHYIIKDAAEAEKAIGSHDKKAMWKYGDQQNHAASILGYRQRGGKQIPEPKKVYEEEISKDYEHSRGGESLKVRKVKGGYYGNTGKFTFRAKTHKELHTKLKNWGYRTEEYDYPDPKPRSHGPETPREKASHADRMGSTLDANHSSVHDHTKREHAGAPTWSPSWKRKEYAATSKSFAQRTKLKEDATPHAGYEMNFSDRTEHQFFGADEARRDRDAYAKHLKSQGKKVKLGSLRNQILHGSYGHVYSVTHKRMGPGSDQLDEAKHSLYKMHGVSQSYDPQTEKWSVDHTEQEVLASSRRHALNKTLKKLQALHPHHKEHEVRLLYKIDEAYDMAFNESGAADHLAQFSHHWAQFKLHNNLSDTDRTHLTKRNHHEREMNKHYKNLTTQQKNALRLTESVESYKVGDNVVPKIGPHKGQVHRVIHVHDTGHLNITPAKPGRNRYHLGAAKADPKDVARHLKEDKTDSEKGFTERHPHLFWDPDKQYKKETLTRAERRRAITHPSNNPIVREAFEAAKAKKLGFPTDKDPGIPGDEEDERQSQEQPQEQPPTFGDKDQAGPAGAAAPQAKQSNVPKPEKKTDKIKVEGPGPEDQFQQEPEVTGLTALVKA